MSAQANNGQQTGEEGGGGGRRVDERDGDGEEEEQTPVEEVTGTGTKDNKSWYHFSSNKTPETPKNYIDKFKDQTQFIFGVASVDKSGYLYGTKEKKPLKVILKSLYNEYYKKMMDGVLEFTTDQQLNKDVENMFKRALQALAEKKRIDEAAPPYYYPEEGKEAEPSKSVISQMVVYEKIDGKETKKRLPILIYDPCIFELENGMKPSNDVNNFHNNIRKTINKYELVGLLYEDIRKHVPILYKKKIQGGGKYVGGGSPPVGKVWGILKEKLDKAKSDEGFVIALRGGITDIYINKSLNIEKTVEKNRGFMEYQVIMLMLYIIKSDTTNIGEETIKKMIINIDNKDYNLLDYVVHILYPDVFSFKKKTFDTDVDKFEQKYPSPPSSSSSPAPNLLFGFKPEVFEGLSLPEKITRLIINYKNSLEDAVQRRVIKSKLIENIDTVKSFFTNYNLQQDVNDKKYIDFMKERNREENEVMKLLSKNLDIQYEGVRSEGTSTLESMKRGFAKRFNAFGSEKKETSPVEEDASVNDQGGEVVADSGDHKEDVKRKKSVLGSMMKGVGFGSKREAPGGGEGKGEEGDEADKTAEEAPENILLKYILNYGVWKLRNNDTDEKLFMIEPKMMDYLLIGTPTRGYISNMFLSINYTPENVGTFGFGAKGAKIIPMKTEKKENVKFYEKEFSYNEYKYEFTGQETQENYFNQSEWYSELNKMQQTQSKGGQSKNTTAKKNKSKRNKSKRNKSKKNK
jgi:hypothetical protein